MITEQNARKIGKEFAFGVVDALVVILVVGLIGLLLFNFVWNLTGFGTDDCDQSSWKRCKMEVLTDYKTGVQYLSTSEGGLVKREKN